MAVAQRMVAALRRIHLFNQEEIKLAYGHKNTVLWNNFRHLIEEAGEMAKCLRGTNDEPMKNEAIDAAICALACALLETDGDIEPLLDVMDMKLDKWQGKLEK